MEDPHWHWEVVGEADGSTTKEVADALALKDKEFARHYDKDRLLLWGWRLSLNPNNEETQ